MISRMATIETFAMLAVFATGGMMIAMTALVRTPAMTAITGGAAGAAGTAGTARTRSGRRRRQAARRLFAAAAIAALSAWCGGRPAAATQVKIFQTQSAIGFLGGKLAGVSVDALGRMRLAPRAERVAAFSEPFLFSAVALHGRDGDTWAVGTGNSGKVLAVDRAGKVRELFAAPEPEVFALWADPDGTLYAGTSPHGKVYRIAGGKSSVFFDPGELYIWALGRDASGRLLVATGIQGKLFRVDASGHGEVALTVEDTHIRSLLPLPDGDVMVGTAGKGLIVRLGRDGKAHTVYECEEPEVVALAAAPDGNVYAAADASEASLVDLARENGGGEIGGAPGGAVPGAGGAPGARPGGKPAKPQPNAVPEESGDPGAIGSRRGGSAGPRSELLRLAPDGRVESLWTFPTDTVFSLLWQRDRLWVGTGVEGKLFAYAGGQTMEIDGELDDRQVVALLPGDRGPAFATTNGAALYRISAATERHGTYTSATLDAGQLARFGTFRWRGELPPGAELRFAFRTGLSAIPDGTWSEWQTPSPAAGEAAPADAAKAGTGREISLSGLPRGRFVQWRAELRAGGGGGGGDDQSHGRGQESDRGRSPGSPGSPGSPVIHETELSYRQDNLRPRITALAALDPGQILVPATFNPSNQVYEPAHPNRDGIFVPVGTPSGDEGGGRTKPLWKMGFQTLRWSAVDPNEDALVYDLYVRPAGAPDGAGWLKVATDLEEDHYSFDATALPDGLYRFRLVASDRLANDPDAALAAERISEPVVIDHTPPALVSVDRSGGAVRVTLRDALSPIREAVWSVDAAAWKPARAADGLLDGKTETVVIDAPEAQGDHLLLLRVTDAAYNVVTFNLSRGQ